MGEHSSKDAVTVQFGKAKEPSVSMKEPGRQSKREKSSYRNKTENRNKKDHMSMCVWGLGGRWMVAECHL